MHHLFFDYEAPKNPTRVKLSRASNLSCTLKVTVTGRKVGRPQKAIPYLSGETAVFSFTIKIQTPCTSGGDRKLPVFCNNLVGAVWRPHEGMFVTFRHCTPIWSYFSYSP